MENDIFIRSASYIDSVDKKIESSKKTDCELYLEYDDIKPGVSNSNYLASERMKFNINEKAYLLLRVFKKINLDDSYRSRGYLQSLAYFNKTYFGIVKQMRTHHSTSLDISNINEDICNLCKLSTLVLDKTIKLKKSKLRYFCKDTDCILVHDMPDKECISNCGLSKLEIECFNKLKTLSNSTHNYAPSIGRKLEFYEDLKQGEVSDDIRDNYKSVIIADDSILFLDDVYKLMTKIILVINGESSLYNNNVIHLSHNSTNVFYS